LREHFSPKGIRIGITFTPPNPEGLVRSNLLGLTITWGESFGEYKTELEGESLGEYATDFEVSVYNGNNLNKTVVVSDNKDIVSVVDLDVKDFNFIRVRISQVVSR
jgi:hypothetical protein